MSTTLNKALASQCRCNHLNPALLIFKILPLPVNDLHEEKKRGS
jgi:hypothetical protein